MPPWRPGIAGRSALAVLAASAALVHDDAIIRDGAPPAEGGAAHGPSSLPEFRGDPQHRYPPYARNGQVAPPTVDRGLSRATLVPPGAPDSAVKGLQATVASAGVGSCACDRRQRLSALLQLLCNFVLMSAGKPVAGLGTWPAAPAAVSG